MVGGNWYSPIGGKHYDQYLSHEAVLLFNLAMTMGVIISINNTVMSIKAARHRWRICWVVANTIGMFGSLIGFSFRITDFAVICATIALCKGFADPRLHFQSIKRSKSKPIAFLVAFGAVCHHAGGTVIVADLAKIQNKTVEKNGVLDFPYPFGALLFLEMVSWTLETQFLLRIAPNWVPKVMIGIELSLAIISVIMLVSVDGVQLPGMIALIVGCVVVAISLACGLKTSTHEKRQKNEDIEERIQMNDIVYGDDEVEKMEQVEDDDQLEILLWENNDDQKRNESSSSSEIASSNGSSNGSSNASEARNLHRAEILHLTGQ